MSDEIRFKIRNLVQQGRDDSYIMKSLDISAGTLGAYKANLTRRNEWGKKSNLSRVVPESALAQRAELSAASAEKLLGRMDGQVDVFRQYGNLAVPVSSLYALSSSAIGELLQGLSTEGVITFPYVALKELSKTQRGYLLQVLDRSEKDGKSKR